MMTLVPDNTAEWGEALPFEPILLQLFVVLVTILQLAHAHELLGVI